MSLLFLDDDPARHRLFLNWLEYAPLSRILHWPHSMWQHENRTVPRPLLHAVYTVEEALETLRAAEPVEIAFLDHDLDGRTYVEEREGTGTEVAEFIAALPTSSRPRRIIVHSFNSRGAQRMLDVLLACGCQATALPFGSEDFMRVMQEL